MGSWKCKEKEDEAGKAGTDHRGWVGSREGGMLTLLLADPPSLTQDRLLPRGSAKAQKASLSFADFLKLNL